MALAARPLPLALLSLKPSIWVGRGSPLGTQAPRGSTWTWPRARQGLGAVALSLRLSDSVSSCQPLVFGAMVHRDEAFETIFSQYVKITAAAASGGDS